MEVGLLAQPTKTYLLFYHTDTGTDREREKHVERPTLRGDLTINIHTAASSLVLRLRLINFSNETVDEIYTKLIEFPH